MSEWISVDESLPKAGVVVIASGLKHKSIGGGQWVEPVIYDEDCFHPLKDDEEGMYVADFDAEMNEVTHWMPLPEPPKC